MWPVKRTVSRVILKTLLAYLLNRSLRIMKSSNCSKDIRASNVSFSRYIKALSNGIMWTGSMRRDEEPARIEAENVGVTYMTETRSDDGPLRGVLYVAWSIFKRNSNPTHLPPTD